MITFTDWADVREALTERQEQHLIESWREVPGRGLVVIAADMEEVELVTLHAASWFLAGIASAECAYRDGKADHG